MSFWATSVITGLLTAFPFGNEILEWIWGGFAVDQPTLNRFFSLHFTLPFIIVALALFHIYLLHIHKSTSPLISFRLDKIPFNPYFVLKDLVALLVLFLILFFIVFFMPNIFGHPDNNIPADPSVTPAHIVPEWYFLPFYAILRSIPSKLIGVLSLVGSILSFFLVPFLNNSSVRYTDWSNLSRVFFFLFLCNFVFLGFIGSNVVEVPYLELGQLASGYFLCYIIIYIPFEVRIFELVFSKLIKSYSYLFKKYEYTFLKWRYDFGF